MQKITTQKTVLILIFVSIVVAFFYFYKIPTLQQANAYKCPETYAENDVGTTEYRNALVDWTTSFFDANPGAIMSDWALAKSQFWVDNNCIVAIERAKLSGGVADLKRWELVDYEVQNAIQSTTNPPN